jgi:hypothetical protein
MAKMTALQVLNQVLQNIGEDSTLTGLTSLSGIQLTAWNKIKEAIQDITTDQNTRWQFLESLGEISLTTNNYSYTVTGLTTGSDMNEEDRESFRQPDTGRNLKYITPQEFDQYYPKGISTDTTGYPNFFTLYGGSFYFDKMATATENGKLVKFRYWRYPTYYSTSTATGTSEIPEPYDMTLLVALATLKVLTYLGNSEAAVYKIQVFGNGSDIEGSLDKMKRTHTSPVFKPRFTAVL